MCSRVSTELTRMTGVEVLVVERRGKLRLNPQSPLERDDRGVLMESCVGCGRVADSELNVTVEASSEAGRCRGVGIENIRDALRRAPPGETDRVAMANEDIECPVLAFCGAGPGA